MGEDYAGEKRRKGTSLSESLFNMKGDQLFDSSLYFAV
jgi:hypothetical protein